MDNISIQLENVSKQYRLGVVNTNTLKADMQRFMARIRGKEDPFLKVGQVNVIGNHGNGKKVNDEYVWALQDINLEVKQGEVLGIIGKNGAGKSTLLKLLSRVTGPTTGEIKVRGRIASLLEVGTGFHQELTGRENIYLNGAVLGMTKLEISRKFDEIVDFSGVEKYIDTPVKRYSSGMNVRLAFAVAAHLDPEVLIVDEVLAVGDAEFQKKAIGKMQDVSKAEGRTVLFVSHIMGAIEQLCNRCVLIENGTLTADSFDVQSIIKKYIDLSRGANTSETIWENLSNTLRNKFFTPQSLYLTDAAGRIIDDVINRKDEITINLKFSVDEVTPLLEVGIVLIDERENIVFVSQFTDKEQREWPVITQGANHLKVNIPYMLLNEGKYRLELRSYLYQKSAICTAESGAPCIYFTIKGGLSNSPYWYNQRNGIIAPILDWKNN